MVLFRRRPLLYSFREGERERKTKGRSEKAPQTPIAEKRELERSGKVRLRENWARYFQFFYRAPGKNRV